MLQESKGSKRLHSKKGIVILTTGLLFEFPKLVNTAKSQVGVCVSGGSSSKTH